LTNEGPDQFFRLNWRLLSILRGGGKGFIVLKKGKKKQKRQNLEGRKVKLSRRRNRVFASHPGGGGKQLQQKRTRGDYFQIERMERKGITASFKKRGKGRIKKKITGKNRKQLQIISLTNKKGGGGKGVFEILGESDFLICNPSDSKRRV